LEFEERRAEALENKDSKCRLIIVKNDESSSGQEKEKGANDEGATGATGMQEHIEPEKEKEEKVFDSEVNSTAHEGEIKTKVLGEEEEDGVNPTLVWPAIQLILRILFETMIIGSLFCKNFEVKPQLRCGVT